MDIEKGIEPNITTASCPSTDTIFNVQNQKPKLSRKAVYLWKHLVDYCENITDKRTIENLDYCVIDYNKIHEAVSPVINASRENIRTKLLSELVKAGFILRNKTGEGLPAIYIVLTPQDCLKIDFFTNMYNESKHQAATRTANCMTSCIQTPYSIYNNYSNKNDSYSAGKDRERFIKRIRYAYKQAITSFTLEQVIDIFNLFFQKYFIEKEKAHPPICKSKLEKIINILHRYQKNGEYHEIKFEDYAKMIDYYFAQNWTGNDRGFDPFIFHFVSVLEYCHYWAIRRPEEQSEAE